MSDISNTGQCWSWRSCFAAVKHNKTKIKKQQNIESCPEKHSLNDHLSNKGSHFIDKNPHFSHDPNLTHKTNISKESKRHITSNSSKIKTCTFSNENAHNFVDRHDTQETADDTNSTIINQKLYPPMRTTHLDVIVEDSNEENSDDYEGTQPLKLYCDSDLISDAYDLYYRLSDLSKTDHIIMQLNDSGYLLQEFTRQIDKFKVKLDETKRASVELPRYPELLEARYSTLLANIESLSLLLKIGQVSSYYSFVDHLICSIEQRIEQLKKYLKLSSSINLRQQRQDFNDDDFLSFRSALSSYEHLSSVPS